MSVWTDSKPLPSGLQGDKTGHGRTLERCEQKFTISPGYTAGQRPSWATRECVRTQERARGTGEDQARGHSNVSSVPLPVLVFHEFLPLQHRSILGGFTIPLAGWRHFPEMQVKVTKLVRQ